MRPSDPRLLRRVAVALAAAALWLGAAVPSVAASPPFIPPPEEEAGTPEEEEEEADAAPVIYAPDPEPAPAPKKPKTAKKQAEKPGKKGAAAEKPAKGKPAKGDPRCGGRTPIYEYVVRSGDHLGKIAGQFGVRAQDILKLNAKVKANPNKLSVGQKVLVCPDIAPHLFEEGTHVVKSGDSWSAIAEKHGMTVRELKALQKGSIKAKRVEKDLPLQPGDEITVLIDRGVLGAFAPPDEDKGVLKIGVQLDPGKHYYIKRPYLAYGTSHTIKAIKAAISRYAQQKGVKGGPQVHVGDISARGGGPLKGHKSHQKGLDVDVGLVLKGDDAAEVRFLAGRLDNLDISRTWTLLKAFIDTNEVRAIFLDYGLQKLLYEHAKKKGVREATLDELFQYPRGKGRSYGIIRHWKGHRDHFHVRFRR